MKKLVFTISVLFGLLIQAQVEEKEDLNIKDIPFAIIEEVPIHPKCVSLSTNKTRKKCLNSMMIKHVQKHFNAEIANCIKKEKIYDEELGKDVLKCVSIRAGIKRIYVMFKISEAGEIEDVTARASHPILKEEGIRIAKLLPKMIPGKHKGVPVKVGYTLPITFNVE